MVASDDAARNANTPDGWMRCTVQDIVHPEKNSCVGGPFGSNLTSKDYVYAPGIPVSRGNNLTLGEERYIDRDFVFVSERKAATLFQNTAFPGDLVFTQRGTIGQIGLIPINARFSAYILSQNQMKLRPDEARANSVFLYYYFISGVAQNLIQQNSIGSTIPGFNLGQLRAFPLVLPSLPEQRAIAHILGTLDDKIELNRRMNETLEAMAQAIFKSWFVDFDPVRAKAEGRDTGLPQPIADLFPDSFEDSDVGEIPKGWEMTGLGELIETVKGRSYTSEELVESDTALVTLKSFARGGGYRPEGLKSFAGTYKPEQVVKSGELVISCTDVTQAAEVIGRPAIVRGTAGYQTLVASLDTLIVRPRDPCMTRAFLYFLGKTEAFVAHTYAHTIGTTVLHLAKEAVPSFRFACPSARLVELFDSLASPALDRVQASEQESDTLALLRDALLPKLISGELRVKDAEKFAEKAL